ncbi:MAG TPA: protein translocase subunit SecF [Candidatus Limadaptatus stercoripullorum]|uniref:Protein-export membrane protein SecF n=1 Tax=Candidatus Limadaptatus stercoripullorum TaxID=2840846 RepID=A0A9D1N959_9FIRM|nr:protein translocase subunit SecF [Candidatus Limadaptatus stercoripullorum]
MKADTSRFIDKLNNFSVTRLKKITFVIPAIIVLIAVLVVVGIGAQTGNYSAAVGIGIDFEGGTMLTVRIGVVTDENSDIQAEIDKITDAIEKVRDENGMGVTVTYIQRSYDDGVAYDPDATVTFRYQNVSSDNDSIQALNEAIVDAVDALYPDHANSELNFITRESIGATAAQDLLEKAGIALAVSTVLILIYIVIRFTLVSGFAAVLALLHDVIVMFALTVICRVQINTSFVAAMITIIAYSINNTIIIFDRCREHMRPLKGMRNIDYDAIGDLAVRETMRRSLFTTLTTMITVIFLAALGSASIREFCIPIILGLIAGAYSSIFMAVPMWTAFARTDDKLREKRMGAAAYDVKPDDEDDPTVYRGEADEKTKDGSAMPPGGGGKKDGAPKGKKIYKYSKKNTTFKKKK